ncbi:DNA-invertase hin [bioreactor metagenome]|uniref:DNA-invertase hin n=1 Tax=bioreactor metagenome TaxID=1076179 RepID=A0A645FRE1_9ZZZZ
MKYGYARCSTNETKQDISRQIKELQNMGVDRSSIFLEYESGTKINRIELARLLAAVTNGDWIVSTEVSRITRSTKQLCEIIEVAKDKHLMLVFGTFVVDCTKELDPMTEGMLKMMGVFSEIERNMISQRVKSGIANARSKGKRVGRPQLIPSDIPAKVIKTFELYHDGNISKVDYARICGISRPTLDKYLSIMAES